MNWMFNKWYIFLSLYANYDKARNARFPQSQNIGTQENILTGKLDFIYIFNRRFYNK